MINFILKYLFHGIAFVSGMITKYFVESILNKFYLNKIPKIQYEINISLLDASEDDYLKKTQTSHYNKTISNVYLCTITLTNISNKDFKDLEIILYTDTDSIIWLDNTQKSETENHAQITDNYLKKFKKITRHSNVRTYNIPVLTRNNNITFSCCITHLKGRKPDVILGFEHKGLKLIPKLVKPEYIFGERKDLCARVGFIISVFLMIPVIKYISSPSLVRIIEGLLGALYVYFGILALKMYKFVRKYFVSQTPYDSMQ